MTGMSDLPDGDDRRVFLDCSLLYTDTCLTFYPTVHCVASIPPSACMISPTFLMLLPGALSSDQHR